MNRKWRRCCGMWCNRRLKPRDRLLCQWCRGVATKQRRSEADLAGLKAWVLELPG